MLRLAVLIFGIGFIFAGVAAFMPAYMKHGLFLGYFEVNTMHNVIHAVSGVVAIVSALNMRYAKLYFKIFGILYGIVAIVGFALKGDLSFMMMHMNMADNVLHAIIAVVALYLGFFAAKRVSN
ncbi:MAG: DUF4383 domain-containing protein [Gammaproteobacteria bacterium]|nr:DUF4383 domain-containing protein [Gammaproteobacteria bacterium]